MKMKREVATYLIMAALVAVAFLLIYSFSFRFTGQVVLGPDDNANLTINDIDFSANVSDPMGIQNVSLLINEKINQTNSSGLNGTYIFPLTLPDGTYNWSILVFNNNNQSNETIVRTLTIDTIEPEEFLITIHSPLEDEEYDTGEVELNVTANKEVNVWRYIFNGNETEFIPNTIITATEGENTLIVYANDTDGEEVNASVSFSVLVPSCSNDLGLCTEEEECTDADRYWYDAICSDECTSNDQCDSDYECSDGSCVKIATKEPEEPEESLPPPISFTSSEILPLSVNPGSSQESSIIVTNTGETPLSSCRLKLMGGELDSWISISEEIININPNEERGFSFSVAVPEETEENSYSLKVATLCSNMYKIHGFVVNVEKKKLEFEVISADRTRSNRVRIIYSLEELAGEEQNVVFTFSLVDVSNAEMGNAEVNQSIDANSTDEFRINIEINESLLPINETTNETLESELTLNVNFNSEIYSSSVRETITLGAPIGGFAIFEGVGAGEAIIFVIVLFVLVFIFIFARRMRRKGKTLKDLVKGKGPEPTK